MEINSSAFENNGRIPEKYCDTGVNGGQNVSIPLSWANPPEGTKSFFLVIVDKHEIANNWLHWVVADIPANATGIPEGASNTDQMPAGSVELTGTEGRKGYVGPQPPTGTGDHAYEAHLFALNIEKFEQAGLPGNPTWEGLQVKLQPFTLETVKTIGLFGK